MDFSIAVSEYEPEINEVEVPILNRDLCNAWLRELNVTDGMICAGYKEGGKDACQVSWFFYYPFMLACNTDINFYSLLRSRWRISAINVFRSIIGSQN